MVRQPSSPRPFLVACTLTISLILLLYSILVLYPSYVSGMYLSRDPSVESFTVPIYHQLTNTIWDGDNFWLHLLLDFILMGVFILTPIYTIIMVAVVGWRWRMLPNRERLCWFAFIAFCWGLIVLTAQAGRAFGIWLAD
jgi:hypothetical protein